MMLSCLARIPSRERDPNFDYCTLKSHSIGKMYYASTGLGAKAASAQAVTMSSAGEEVVIFLIPDPASIGSTCVEFDRLVQRSQDALGGDAPGSLAAVATFVRVELGSTGGDPLGELLEVFKAKSVPTDLNFLVGQVIDASTPFMHAFWRRHAARGVLRAFISSRTPFLFGVLSCARSG